MGLLDEVQKLQARSPGGGRRCGLCLEVDPQTTNLTPKSDAVELAEAFANPGISASTIVKVLGARGVKTATNTVQRHRREHVEGWNARR